MSIITKEELKKMLDDQDEFVLIDVLPQDSYRKCHLPGAINIPLDETFEEKILNKVPDKSRMIVVYCGSRQCQASPTATGKLIKMGYKKVFDYEGGLNDWKNAGYPAYIKQMR